MPLPKPNKAEITRILHAREISHNQENLFEPVSAAAIAALEGGFINQEKANTLLAWLESNHRISALYPNAQLIKALKTALVPGVWSQDLEHDLLRFISAVYLNPESLQDNIYDLLLNPTSLFGDLYVELFDVPNTIPELHERLCAFTGPCEFGSRSKCYDAVTMSGGAPCTIATYTDYLFVSEQHISARVLSSSMADGVCVRMMFGNLLICSEHFFKPKSDPIV